jgi:hypothetical protein
VNRRAAAVAIAVTTTAMVVVADLLVLDHHRHGWPHGFGYWFEGSLSLPIWLVVGVVLVFRVPGNALGPLALFFSVASGTQLLTGAAGTEMAADHATTPAVNLLAAISAAAQVTVVGTLLIFALLAPTGHPVSSRWRWLVIAASAALAVLAVAQTSIDESAHALVWVARAPWHPIPGPAWDAVLTVANVVASVALAGVVVGLWLRWRRGAQVERQQLKVISFAAILAVTLGVVIQPIMDRISPGSHVVGSVIWTVIPAALPVATTFAILRYGLYDIDRVVSRTLSYAVVTGLIVGVYVWAIAVANAFVGLVGVSSSAAVAASTLLAAAAFQPVRRRVQRVVDSRFDRTGYDARKTVEAFSARLRDEVDVDAVSMALLTTAARSVAPASASLWTVPT